jgi:ABC-2 type transport system permease protein
MKYLSTRNKAIVGELVRADFKVRYQGSILGYTWSLLRPLLLFSVLYVIFVYIIPLGDSVEHFPVYLLTGVIMWNFFVEATSQGLISVVSKGDLLRKVNMPKYLLVISSAVSASINMLLSLVVLVIFALSNGVMPNIRWFLMIPLIIELFAFSLGLSLLFSSLYVKFRDMSYIWEVFLQIGFYASAIIFPLSAVAEHLRHWFFLNPVVQIIQDMRYAMATKSSVTIWNTVDGWRLLIPFIIIAITIVVGILVFRKKSRTFAEDI